jgi:hypothetical protein
MSFKGEIEVLGLYAATRTLHLVGKGSDTSGTSGASMDLVARIDPGATEGTSNLVGKSEVTMSGKAAAFGGRMMGSVADQILKQFAANFAARVQAEADAAATETSSVTAVVATAGAAPTATSPITAADSTAAAAAPPPAGEAAMSAAVSSAAPTSLAATNPGAINAGANELNVLALFWAIIRDWFRGLFRRKPA